MLNETNIDKILHVLGGASISLSAAGTLQQLIRRRFIGVLDGCIFRVLIFGCVCIAIICWEIIEYITDFGGIYLTYRDTITDMMFGAVGGVIGILTIRARENRLREH